MSFSKDCKSDPTVGIVIIIVIAIVFTVWLRRVHQSNGGTEHVKGYTKKDGITHGKKITMRFFILLHASFCVLTSCELPALVPRINQNAPLK